MKNIVHRLLAIVICSMIGCSMIALHLCMCNFPKIFENLYRQKQKLFFALFNRNTLYVSQHVY